MAARTYQTKGAIALAELDRGRAVGVTCGTVLADSGYGASAAFRPALTASGLRWAVGIPCTQKVFLAHVHLRHPRPAWGRPHKNPSRRTSAGVPSRRWRRGAGAPSAGALGRRAHSARGSPPYATAWPTGRWPPAISTLAGRAGVAGGGIANEWRAEVRPDQSRRHDAATHRGSGHQSPLGMRASAPATQGRAGPRSLRGPELA